jgi:Acyl-protein synthetase, LuxE
MAPAPESPLAVNPLRGYILLPGCRGKPAWLNKNRMSSTSELSGFAARLRESILMAEWGARTSVGSALGESHPDTAPGARASSPLWASLNHSRAPVTIGRPKRAGSPRAGLSAVTAGVVSGRAALGACEADFEALAKQLFALQFEHNGAYRRLCEARGARPDTVAHWTDIPAAPTSAFKEFDLSCLPVEERTTVFHSSGTTGQPPSRHFHNARSLALYEASLLRWFAVHLLPRRMTGSAGIPAGVWLHGWDAGRNAGAPDARAGKPATCGLAVLTPPPSQAPHSSLVHMFETIRREAGWEGSAFVGKVAKDGAWTLDAGAALERLRAASGSGQPLLMLGTAFSFVQLLDHLADRDLCFQLPPGSCVLETGGYKGRSRSLPKPALHSLITQRLGIPSTHIVCEYGMSELSSQAYHWEIGGVAAESPGLANSDISFRFPPWARVQIVSPETGLEAGQGETGLIRVFDLANVYSVMAIQTEDLGIRRGDGFELVGRAAEAEARGCSLMAV